MQNFFSFFIVQFMSEMSKKTKKIIGHVFFISNLKCGLSLIHDRGIKINVRNEPYEISIDLLHETSFVTLQDFNPQILDIFF